MIDLRIFKVLWKGSSEQFLLFVASSASSIINFIKLTQYLFEILQEKMQ